MFSTATSVIVIFKPWTMAFDIALSESWPNCIGDGIRIIDSDIYRSRPLGCLNHFNQIPDSFFVLFINSFHRL